MTRPIAMSPAPLLLALAVLAAGPAISAGSGGGDDAAADLVVDEDMLPHPVSLPGSYVALPDDIVTKIRNKILISRGEEPMKDDSDDKKKGGH
jgi:hypothetical protein